MSQHDYNFANQAGAPFRADTNSALAAIVSQNSGATEPTTTFAYMPWFDTTTGILKFRNAGNSGWVVDDLNSARGSVTMHATTMDLWAEPKIIDGTGSAVTITDIADAPQAGAVRTLYPVAGTVITDGATFDVDGGDDYTTAAGDALIFEAVTTSTFKVHIVKSDGTPVISGSTAPPLFSAYRASSDQSMSTSTFTKVQINSEQADTNGNFDSTTNYRFTPSIPGYYLIGGVIDWSSSSSDGAGIAIIYKNGSSYKRGSGVMSTAVSCNVCSLVDLTVAGDYVELYGFKSGTTAVITLGSDKTYFYGHLVRPV